MSNDTKHTPGPWRAQFAGCLIRAENGDDIANVCQYGPQSETPEAQAANARLIAAAPDLLAALQAICNAKDDAEDWAAMSHARAAIARATT